VPWLLVLLILLVFIVLRLLMRATAVDEGLEDYTQDSRRLLEAAVQLLRGSVYVMYAGRNAQVHAVQSPTTKRMEWKVVNWLGSCADSTKRCRNLIPHIRALSATADVHGHRCVLR
jgi:uncharacterized protein (DUF3084 family)